MTRGLVKSHKTNCSIEILCSYDMRPSYIISASAQLSFLTVDVSGCVSLSIYLDPHQAFLSV